MIYIVAFSFVASLINLGIAIWDQNFFAALGFLQVALFIALTVSIYERR
jgi:hypothetical protein